MVEGHTPQEYVIVDDFMDSGRTIRRIIKQITTTDSGRCDSKCVGVILYDGTHNETYISQMEELGQAFPVYNLSILPLA